MSDLPNLPQRAGDLTIAHLIDYYMQHYAGRDKTRVQRLDWWVQRIGQMRMDQVSDDDVHAGVEALAAQPTRFYAGNDVDGHAIFKAKKAPRAPATVNRYSAALAAAFTWAIRRRIAPKGWVHPCRGVERRAENNLQTRFLSDQERERLLAACKASKWSRLYLLVLLALTTGARKGSLLALRWRDIDLSQRVLHIGRSKNGAPLVLPLTPNVAEELAKVQGAPSGHVFPSERRPDCAYCIEPRWHEAMHVAKVKNFKFHDLRHSAASYLAQNGATLLQIGDLLGHRDVSVTLRYAHLAATDRAALVNRVFGDIG